ncbi:hypothetical protein BB8028_0004g11180 [Beauveria bassiana]|uniref:Uncharacterized protein n=1 Tax=Beauveria bassiana TaxID=176275 RepID=A0A2S7YDE7_BEABA|nr:hypothetical protein BB8028_0004g11180 [Beauveria bassiana]
MRHSLLSARCIATRHVANNAEAQQPGPFQCLPLKYFHLFMQTGGQLLNRGQGMPKLRRVGLCCGQRAVTAALKQLATKVQRSSGDPLTPFLFTRFMRVTRTVPTQPSSV